MVRNAQGSIGFFPEISDLYNGVFYRTGAGNMAAVGSAYQTALLHFSIDRVIKTGSENSPRTMSVQYWRRVS
jgi:hypothetical protein